MIFFQPAADLIRKRYSCRKYLSRPISEKDCTEMASFLASFPAGPFNGPNRFQLTAASIQDRGALSGLGTYGFIQNPPGFIIGATRSAEKELEDFGYRMELIVLKAADIGLGTCWLGGTFTRSGFTQKISAEKGESIPAVCAVGYPAIELSQEQIDFTRDRLDWGSMFFGTSFERPMTRENAGSYTLPLEMVRLAPSASNKQPWRIVKQGGAWHFYIHRTKGYREMALSRFTGIADMQRIDLGIALAHFELAALEAGLAGQWLVKDPGLDKPDHLTEYSVSWIPAKGQN